MYSENEGVKMIIQHRYRKRRDKGHFRKVPKWKFRPGSHKCRRAMKCEWKMRLYLDLKLEEGFEGPFLIQI